MTFISTDDRTVMSPVCLAKRLRSSFPSLSGLARRRKATHRRQLGKGAEVPGAHLTAAYASSSTSRMVMPNGRVSRTWRDCESRTSSMTCRARAPHARQSKQLAVCMPQLRAATISRALKATAALKLCFLKTAVIAKALRAS